MHYTRKIPFVFLLLALCFTLFMSTGCERKADDPDPVDTTTDDAVSESGIDSSIQRHDRAEMEKQGIEVRGLYEKALEDGVAFPYNEEETL